MTRIFPTPTDSDDLVFIRTAMPFQLKEKLKTNWLLISPISFSSIPKAWCTLRDSFSTSPVARLTRFPSAVNESLFFNYSRILKPLEWSLVNRACVISLCWWLFWYVAPVTSCIVLVTYAVRGIKGSPKWIPHPLVKPPDVFKLWIKLCIRTCSITRSGKRPAQKRLLLRITCCPFMKCLCNPGWITWIWDIVWKYKYIGFI